MINTIFAETFRRGWKTALYWGLGIGIMAWLQIIIVQDTTLITETARLMESVPPFILEMFGGTSDMQFLATPDGYLALQFFGFILLVFAFYAAVAGLNVTANDEDAGIMDIFLSLPVVRWQLVLTKVLAFILLSALVVGVTLACMLIGFAMVPNIFDVGRMVLASLNILPSMLVVLSFTALAAAIFRRKSSAIALTAAFIIGSYTLDFLGNAAPDTILAALRKLSFFAYYDSTGVIQNGLSIPNVIILLAASVIFAIIAMWRYQRRDIGL